MARSCLHVSQGMSHGPVCYVLTTASGASDGAVEHLRSLSGFLVLDICPPAPAGGVLTDMPAEIHFGAFTAVFMAVLKYGTGDAPVMCTHPVRIAQDALAQVNG